MNVLVCSEAITVDYSCPSGWVATAYSAPFDIASLSPEVAVQYFGAGFALPIVPLVAVFSVTFILKMIKG